MSCVEIKRPPTLVMIPSTEEKSPTEWEAQYIEAVWLFLEVTQKDESQVHRARLIATAADDAEFLGLAHAYQAQAADYMITRGIPNEPSSAIPPPTAKHWLAFTPHQLPIVPVTLGSESVPTLLATGAEVSLISPTLAARQSRSIMDCRPLAGMTGAVVKAPITTIENLQVAHWTLPSLEAYVLDVQRLGRNIGLIWGVKSLADRKLPFDFATGRVYLSVPKTQTSIIIWRCRL